MKKFKLCVIFGGMSTENEVSVISANSILKNLDRLKYDIFPIYIDKKGIWYTYNGDIEFQKEITNKIEIKNIIKFLKEMDVIFPVLHGLYGEDGTIQGLFELIKIPYVGCKVLASSVGMDKVYTKIIFEKAGIKQTKYKYIRKYNDKYIYVDERFNEKILNISQIIREIEKDLKYPLFIKPSNSGSSVGINKAKTTKELEKYIQYASKFDNKILIEEEIMGRELECAVLGNEEVISSCVGEIKPAEEFYSYDAKYKNQESKICIPADISEEQTKQIQQIAIKAFKAIDAKGLSRVDFFLEKGTQDIYINEINTMPGFTDISMYPKLFEKTGITYKELLDKIINLAIKG